jgi:hypothetical protein
MFALAEPVPFTVAILMTKSLILAESGADMNGIRSYDEGGIALADLGDLGLSFDRSARLIGGERPMNV